MKKTKFDHDPLDTADYYILAAAAVIILSLLALGLYRLISLFV